MVSYSKMGFSPGAAKTTTPAHEHGGVAAAQVDPSVAPNRVELLPGHLVHHDALHIRFVSLHAEREAVERARVPKTRGAFTVPSHCPSAKMTVLWCDAPSRGAPGHHEGNHTPLLRL